MSMARLQNRLFFLLLLLATVFTAGAFLLRYSERSPATVLLRDMEQQRASLLHGVADLHAGRLSAFASDYSRWDDMVHFLRSNDSLWVEQNPIAALSTFGASLFWICDDSMRVVYRYAPSIRPDELPTPLPRLSAGDLLAGRHFGHFFLNSGPRLVEVCYGPIQPTADVYRTTTPRGYFFVGRILDDNLLADVASHIGATITAEPLEFLSTTWTSDMTSGVVRFADTLSDWYGHPVGVLRGEMRSDMLLDLDRAAHSRVKLLAILAVVLLVVWWVSLKVWISKPLRQVSQALTEQSAQPIRDLVDIRNEFGSISRLILSFFAQKDELTREVHERKLAEHALTTSLERLSAVMQEHELLLASARDFIYRHDSDGNFTYLSPSIEAITGYKPDEFGLHYASTLTDNPANRKAVELTEQELLTARPVPPYQIEVRAKDGHTLILEVCEQPYFKDGKVAGIVGVARDISERVRQEEERVQLVSKLEKAERMESLAILAGGVAHDLNNLLGPLVAYPELMMAEMHDNCPLRLEIEEIGSAANQAAAIVQDLLTMARRGRYQMSSLSLNEVVHTYLASANFRSLCQKNSRVEVNLALDDDLPLIGGSISHLSTVLMNLVVNAFDAMPDGGTLTIRTSRYAGCSIARTGQQLDPGEYVCLSVADSGTGITAEDLERIFEPYYSTKKIGRSGSGLGLAVVHGIVSDHKGCYDVSSTPGQGTCFSLVFPVLSEQSPAIAEKSVMIHGVETILVLDDLQEQRQLAQHLLQSLGYKVVAASTTIEAIELLRQTTVDAAVLDMLLSDSQDGLDAFQALTQLKPDLRAIIVSGYAPTDRVDLALHAGVDGFLRKPYTRQELGEAVRRACDRAVPISPPV